MDRPFEELAALDKLIHEPARLAIMTALSACSSADFTFLQQLTGLTKGNLSSHLSRLEEAGLVLIEKRFLGKTPNTLVSLTKEGMEAIERHWQLLESLRKGAQEMGQIEGQAHSQAQVSKHISSVCLTLLLINTALQ